MDAAAALLLADWRRAVSDLYARARALDGPDAWEVWRAGKERLYREHPESPVPKEQRDDYRFTCFPYDASMRVLAESIPAPPRHVGPEGDVPGMTSVGTLRFTLGGAAHELGVYWLDGYAGGLLVAFVDATSGSQTYGGGRYVLDTAKGADLGSEHGRLVLDFNFAYAPSCAHDPRWQCPLAPPSNRLRIPIRAGEMAA